jgi:hypothetical protein
MWDEADPVTAAAIVAVNEFDVSMEHKLAALDSARETLAVQDALEGELSRSAEYAIAGSAMMRIREWS